MRATSLRWPRCSGSLLAGCSSTLLYTELPPATTRSMKPGAEPPPANQREHQRILAAYNGAYEDAKLEALLNQTVAQAGRRLRAAGHAATASSS